MAELATITVGRDEHGIYAATRLASPDADVPGPWRVLWPPARPESENAAAVLHDLTHALLGAYRAAGLSAVLDRLAGAELSPRLLALEEHAALAIGAYLDAIAGEVT